MDDRSRLESEERVKDRSSKASSPHDRVSTTYHDLRSVVGPKPAMLYIQRSGHITTRVPPPMNCQHNDGFHRRDHNPVDSHARDRGETLSARRGIKWSEHDKAIYAMLGSTHAQGHAVRAFSAQPPSFTSQPQQLREPCAKVLDLLRSSNMPVETRFRLRSKAARATPCSRVERTEVENGVSRPTQTKEVCGG
ncbi:hypothetical protein BDY19DRAFT_908608 [Irpex rosettiformis]|uniref:Uncharacterized protein n=1 Tax=Irpex rosettiformis TaxID=378272 RepID=A0ACB8TVJ9_9APHY|nr:hypothetical protein BDY19DRAFT_908608 [Irpex rosettiformis]